MNYRLSLAATCVAACAAAFCVPASANTVTYAFTGIIDVNNTVNPIRTFTSFTGQLSFDAAKPDTAPADSYNGYYPMGGGGYAMQVVFDDGTIFDMDTSTHYRFSVHVALPGIPGGTPDTGRFSIKGDVAGQVDRFVSLDFRKDFATDALPVQAGGFNLATFDEALFSYHGLDEIAPLPGQPAVPSFGAFGHLTSLACTAGCTGPAIALPEPAPWMLMLAGVGAAGYRVRRGKPAAASRR